MSSFSHDINEVDKIVREKLYRKKFLEKFQEGYSISNFNAEHVQIRLRWCIEIVKGGHVAMEQKFENFALYLGLLIKWVRGYPDSVFSFYDELLALLSSLKENPAFSQFWEMLRKVMLEWIAVMKTKDYLQSYDIRKLNEIEAIL